MGAPESKAGDVRSPFEVMLNNPVDAARLCRLFGLEKGLHISNAIAAWQLGTLSLAEACRHVRAVDA